MKLLFESNLLYLVTRFYKKLDKTCARKPFVFTRVFKIFPCVRFPPTKGELVYKLGYKRRPVYYGWDIYTNVEG